VFCPIHQAFYLYGLAEFQLANQTHVEMDQKNLAMSSVIFLGLGKFMKLQIIFPSHNFAICFL
jgi:hypothetical protein